MEGRKKPSSLPETEQFVLDEHHALPSIAVAFGSTDTKFQKSISVDVYFTKLIIFLKLEGLLNIVFSILRCCV